MATITNFDDLPVVLNANHVQNVLGISRAHTYNLLNSTGFPTVRIGRRLLVGRDALKNWVENRQGKIIQ